MWNTHLVNHIRTGKKVVVAHLSWTLWRRIDRFVYKIHTHTKRLRKKIINNDRFTTRTVLIVLHRSVRTSVARSVSNDTTIKLNTNCAYISKEFIACYCIRTCLSALYASNVHVYELCSLRSVVCATVDLKLVLHTLSANTHSDPHRQCACANESEWEREWIYWPARQWIYYVQFKMSGWKCRWHFFNKTDNGKVFLIHM